MREIKFSENLRTLRLSKDMNQDTLAKLLNVDQRTISNWEKGICEPDLKMLAKLCDIFDETFDSLLT